MTEIMLIGVIIVLLAFIGWRDWFYSRQVDTLTNKLMSHDYREYAIYNKPSEPKREAQPKKEYPRDPVLGATY